MDLRGLGLAAVGALLLTAAPAASANTITVTSTADSGGGTLRQALATAGSGDTVAVPAGRYVLSSGALQVGAGVTVRGAGARGTVIDANRTSGVFTVSGAGVTIEDLTVTGGQTPGSGGGISSQMGLMLHRVAVVANSAAGAGGGVFASGTAAQALLIDHSLIAGNSAAGSGGFESDSSSLGSAVTDSTVTGNSATSFAGGFAAGAGALLIDGDTVVGNSVTGASGQGGNFRVSSGTVARLHDTIIGGGVADAGADCYLGAGATLTSLGHNAEDLDPHPDSDCQSRFVGSGDRTGLALALGTLADNGGPTDTIRPLLASPVVDMGDPAGCTRDDQRGVPRPQGAGCEIGAFEHSAPATSGPSADAITPTGATLHANVATAGLDGSAHFTYGTQGTFAIASAPFALPPAAGVQGAAARIESLAPGTTYQFRIEVATPDGTVSSADASFTTPLVPPTRADTARPRVTIAKPTCAKRLSHRACARLRASRAAWRTLRGTVADAAPSSGIARVEVGVERRVGKRTFALAGTRFKRTTPRHAAATFVRATVRATAWHLKLPALSTGAYTLRVRATDRAGHVAKTVTLHLKLTR